MAIDALAVREWVAELIAGGLSAKRARKAHQVLSQILASAVDGGRLPRNVAEGIKLPKVQRKEMHFLTAAQVEALADAIMPPYGVLVRVAAYTGLRPCEYVALRVGRLDLLRATVRVAEAAPEVAGRLEWGGVKTHEARTVRLPRSVAEELGAYLAGRPHGPADLVFTAPRGGPVRSSKFVPVCFKRLSELRTRPCWHRRRDRYSYLGDNCQSSAQTAPVGCRQLRLGRHSVECGLVGCSRAWWNDHEKDQLSKQ